MLLAILPAMVFAHPLLHTSINLLIWIRLMKEKPDNCLSKAMEVIISRLYEPSEELFEMPTVST